MNFIPATVGDDGITLTLDLGTIRGTLAVSRPLQPGRKVTVGIRPEHIGIAGPGQGSFDVPVAVVESTGFTAFITAATTPELIVVETGRSTIRPGDVVGVRISPDQLHLFDGVSGVRV
jgi:multiple sugar transport system ATP-binding protein